MASFRTPVDNRRGDGGVRSYIDPLALMRIKNLQLRAKAVVEGFYNGLHRSPFHGFSAEFSEYRQYTPGDDPRYLDWRLYARSDRYYIKRFEDETNRRCYLLVDLSRSMGYSSIGYTKADYARTLAATLAYYLTLQRDSVGLLVFDQEVVDYIAARYRPGQLHRVMGCLERAEQGTGTNLHLPLEQIATTVKKRGLVVLISDLLASLETLQTNLGYLRSRGHEVLVLRVLDPAELSFPFQQAVMFRDMESQRDLYIDPAEARKQYEERFHRHDQQIKSTCDDLGVDYSHTVTDRPLERALFDLLRAQLHRGRRRITRHGAATRGRGGGRDGGGVA
jgi:uncharacterized protein (DUF58 family)